MHELNPAQLDAVIAEENLLCCACPGSGKTRMLINKVQHVLARHPDAGIILTTFSRDATNEMRERLGRALSPGLMQKLSVGTFHALALRQIKTIGAAGHILNTIETNHIILRALEETGVMLSLDEAELAISTCKIDPAYAEKNPPAARLTRIYQRELAARGACDFVDIIARANTMMAAGQLEPMPASHVFCDEFQDIDRLQFEWLRHHIAGGREVCVVGDADQCIYGFRRSLGYRGMMDYVAMTGARIITLGANYRSTSRILEHASRLIAHNLDRVKMEMTAVRGDGHAPGTRPGRAAGRPGRPHHRGTGRALSRQPRAEAAGRPPALPLRCKQGPGRGARPHQPPAAYHRAQVHREPCALFAHRPLPCGTTRFCRRYSSPSCSRCTPATASGSRWPCAGRASRTV
jgi:Superfamily I DNA and RNA helicases